MRDRFDHTLERELASKPGGDVVVGPRLAIVTGLGRRRAWPAGEKARIIVESLKPGAVVSEVARRNGLSPQQLSGWRREARDLFAQDRGETRAMPATGDARPSPSMTHGVATSQAQSTTPAFVPVVVTPAPPGSAPPQHGVDAAQRTGVSRTGAIDAGTIEIAIGTIVVRVIGRVDAEALQTVVDIVRRLACS